MLSGQQKIFWCVAIALLLLTRIPNAAQYLSIDNINLALAIDDFDPLNHQPQPPGYPFFVFFSRIVNFFVGDAHRTFVLISLIATGLCLPLIVSLGKSLFTSRTGNAAALLLLVNPVMWQTSIDSPLRPFLALFSLSTAYCAWRAWNGDSRFVLWGAASLGVGSGFRPDLLAYLGIMWLISAWVGARSVKLIIQGGVILAGIMLIWVSSLAYAVGGFGALYALTMNYLVDQSKVESVIMGAEEQGALRQLSRLVVWNGLAVVGWIWAAPFAASSKELRSRWRSPLLFVGLWLAPGLIFQALVHVAAPGHTVFSIPAFCLLGAWVIWSAAERLSPSDPSRFAEVSISAALVLNVLLFLNFFPLPSAPATPSLWQSLKNATAYATYESSLAYERSLDEVAATTLKELDESTPADGRPWIIVTTDETPKEWFMHWLLMRYYKPKAEIWVAAEGRSPKQALLTRAGKTVQTRTGDVIQIPVPPGGRVLWVLENGADFERELRQNVPVESLRRVSYTDINANAAPFRIRSFEFVPVEHGIQ